MFDWFSGTTRNTCLIIGAISCLSFGVSFTSNPITVILIDKGLKEHLALITGVFSLAALTFYLYGGYLTDRFGGKQVAICGLPVMLISALFTGMADNTFQFTLVRMIHGASYAMIFPPLYALLSEHIPTEHNQHLHSLSSGLECFAGGLGFASGLWLLENRYFGWWNSMGTITVVISAVCLIFVPAIQRENEVKRSGMLRFLLQGQRKVYRVASITVGITIAHRVTITYLSLYVGGIAGTVILLANIANVVTFQWIVTKAKKHGNYQLLRVAIALLVISLLAIWVSEKLHFVLAIPCVLIAGILQGIAMRINATSVLQLVQSSATKGKEGSAVATRSFVAEGAIFLGNFFGGWIVFHWGKEVIWLLTIPVVLLSLLPMGRRR